MLKHRRSDGGQEVAVFLDGGKLGELSPDGLGRLKEKTGVRFGQHGGVVEGIAGGDDEIMEAAEGGDGAAFGLRLAQLVAGNPAILDEQMVAENGGPLQLAHEGFGKFLERVGEDDDLGEGAQLAEEIQRAGQGAQGGDDFLNVRQLQSALVEDFDAAAHEFVVIGFVACGAAQIGDVGFFGDGNPDFGDEDALQIQDDNCLFHAGKLFRKGARCRVNQWRRGGIE